MLPCLIAILLTEICSTLEICPKTFPFPKTCILLVYAMIKTRKPNF